MRRVFWILLLVSIFLSFSAVAKTVLVIQTHWSDYQVNGIFNKSGKLIYPGLKQYAEEYMKLHPNIEIKIREVPFSNYLQQLIISHMAGKEADIYDLYSLWGVQLVSSHILAAPPKEIINAVKRNFVPASVKGATINGKVWGIPSEIDDYALIYNKKLLSEAGYTEPPKTWDELVKMARKLTKYNSKGAISQYGFAFLSGWNSAVVHPYLSLLYSLGGSMFNKSYTKCLLNNQKGVKALNEELVLFKEKATNSAGNVFNFPQNTVAMMIMAPWYVRSLKQAYGNQYTKYVGIAPIPPIKKPATLSYTWFFAVDSASKHKKAAWDFLKWFALQVQPKTNTTRAGDLEVNVISVIPPNKIDLRNHQKQLADLKVFIDQLKNAIPEPNVMQGAQIKTILMNQIVAAWNGQKSAQRALDDAVAKINSILARYYH